MEYTTETMCMVTDVGSHSKVIGVRGQVPTRNGWVYNSTTTYVVLVRHHVVDEWE